MKQIIELRDHFLGRETTGSGDGSTDTTESPTTPSVGCECGFEVIDLSTGACVFTGNQNCGATGLPFSTTPPTGTSASTTSASTTSASRSTTPVMTTPGVETTTKKRTTPSSDPVSLPAEKAAAGEDLNQDCFIDFLGTVNQN